MEWSTACLDWERRILAGESLISCPPLFPGEADNALAIFKELKLVDVLGRPTFGEAGRPWLFDFVGSIFGSYDSENGRRLISEYFLLISKKNSKSTGAAGIMMTALIYNWRESAEFVIIAPTVEIASNSFIPARDMVKADPELSDLFHIQEHYRSITHRGTGATLKIIAADNETVGGKKATGILIDEAWIFGKRNNAENMLREACGGLASRPEGFVIWLSTQSDEAPMGVFKQKLDYARGVRDGKIDDNRFLPVIYEFPKSILDDKRHLDPKMFYITNPNLGASVDETFLIREFKKAENDGHESMQGFLAKHLNVEMGLSLKTQQWAGAEYWEDAKREVTLDIILEQSEVVVVGIDGGGLDDLLGLTILGREKITGNWLTWSRAWVHPIAMQRRKSEAERYKDFIKDGDLVLVDEIGKDLMELGAIVRRCLPLMFKVGVDQAGIGAIIDVLEAGDERGENKIESAQILGVPQGWRLNGAIKTAERKLAEKTLLHGGQPLMSWCVGNAKVEPKGNAICITKQVSGTGKIDPLMALFNCVALMAMNPEPMTPISIYEGLTKDQILERMRA
jgi:phage terminase large subunit-like protein